MLKKRLSDIWDKLPDLEHTHKYFDEKIQLRIYEVCGKKFQETTPILNVIDCLNRYYDNYGQRARDAKENKNLDWKAVSHAIRAAYQLKEILEDNTITFPLKEADYVKQVKTGELDYQTDVAVRLESLMDEVESLSLKSDLPEKVNRSFWDDFIINVIGDML